MANQEQADKCLIDADPCRYCGSDDLRIWNRDPQVRGGMWAVFCRKCESSGPIHNFPIRAVELWNDLSNGWVDALVALPDVDRIVQVTQYDTESPAFGTRNEGKHDGGPNWEVVPWRGVMYYTTAIRWWRPLPPSKPAEPPPMCDKCKAAMSMGWAYCPHCGRRLKQDEEGTTDV